MMKRSFALAFFIGATPLLAQDMPPLPPMPDQPAASNTSQAALPPLPDQPAAANNNAALPPLPDQPAAPTNNSSSTLPPLPGQPAEQAGQPPAAASEPVTETVGAPEVKPVKKAAKDPRPWARTKKRPNTIFGGWVTPKGGNESSKLSWTAQEVLNALVLKKYKVVKEEGKYQGEEGAERHQWREITFKAPKSKYEVKVYLRQSAQKVWVRVGPGEPPPFSVNSIAQVQKMRDTNLKALHLIQKQFGRRLSPHRVVRSWEAPYRFAQGTADE